MKLNPYPGVRQRDLTDREEMRGRLNPMGWSVTDVMAGMPWRHPRWSCRMYRAQRGAGRWSRLQCWLVLGCSAAALVLLLVSTIYG